MGTPAPVGLRVCTTCSVEQPLTSYYAHPASAGGRMGKCKVCIGAYNKSRYASGKTAHSTYGGRRAIRLKTFYGITPADYAAMLVAQENRCAICHQPEVLDQPLAVDHSHSTGTVRGLLCMACNTALGKFQDSEALLQSAITYLRASRT